MRSKHEIYKIIIIGKTETGKSNLTNRLTSKALFSDSYAPTVTADVKSNVNIKKNINFNFWDASGKKIRRSANIKRYIKGTQAIIITYDPNDRASFEEVEAFCTLCTKLNNTPCAFLLVATKSDLPLEPNSVTDEEAQKKATLLGMIYAGKTSAKTDEGIDKLLDILIENKPKSNIAKSKTLKSEAKSSIAAAAKPKFKLKNMIPNIILALGLAASIAVAAVLAPIARTRTLSLTHILYILSPIVLGIVGKFLGDSYLKPKKYYTKLDEEKTDENNDKQRTPSGSNNPVLFTELIRKHPELKETKIATNTKALSL